MDSEVKTPTSGTQPAAAFYVKTKCFCGRLRKHFLIVQRFRIPIVIAGLKLNVEKLRQCVGDPILPLTVRHLVLNGKNCCRNHY